MNNENITDSNKLIAEFMGLEIEDTLEGMKVYAIKTPTFQYEASEQTDFFEPEELLYNLSWDWIMPVVEKCKERQIFGSQGLINNIDNRLLQIDLLAVHSNVISFIEFYNLNNSK